MELQRRQKSSKITPMVKRDCYISSWNKQHARVLGKKNRKQKSVYIRVMIIIIGRHVYNVSVDFLPFYHPLVYYACIYMYNSIEYLHSAAVYNTVQHMQHPMWVYIRSFDQMSLSKQYNIYTHIYNMHGVCKYNSRLQCSIINWFDAAGRGDENTSQTLFGVWQKNTNQNGTQLIIIEGPILPILLQVCNYL